MCLRCALAASQKMHLRLATHQRSLREVRVERVQDLRVHISIELTSKMVLRCDQRWEIIHRQDLWMRFVGGPINVAIVAVVKLQVRRIGEDALKI